MPRRAVLRAALLPRLGVLDARPLLIHCVLLDFDDVVRLVDHGCAVAHCPVANARLGHGVAPLGECEPPAMASSPRLRHARYCRR